MSPYEKLTIKQWAVEDRPREKMLKNGLAMLSDAELVAIVIGSGNATESAVELSRRMLLFFRNNLDELGKATVDKLRNEFKGIGEAKAINILAALELGRRRQMGHFMDRPHIKSSNDIWNLIGHDLSHLQYEEFWIIFLDRSNKYLDKMKVSQGGISGTSIDIRLILKPAIEKLASSIVLVHNHPSGNNRPSDQDIEFTRKAEKASKLIDIKVIDHLIVAGKCFYSFADEGLIQS
jgi:DNA repair protein RadC